MPKTLGASKLRKSSTIQSKYPIGSKVTLKSKTLDKDFPPLTGIVKGYENGGKLLISFNGKGMTVISPKQLQPHYEIGNKPVAIRATVI